MENIQIFDPAAFGNTVSSDNEAAESNQTIEGYQEPQYFIDPTSQEIPSYTNGFIGASDLPSSQPLLGDDANFQSVYMGASMYGEAQNFTEMSHHMMGGEGGNTGGPFMPDSSEFMYEPAGQSTASETQMVSSEPFPIPTPVTGDNWPTDVPYPSSMVTENSDYPYSTDVSRSVDPNTYFMSDAANRLPTALFPEDKMEPTTSVSTMSGSQSFPDFNEESSSEGAAAAAAASLTSSQPSVKEQRVLSLLDESIEHSTVMETPLVETPSRVTSELVEDEHVAAMWLWSPAVARTIANFLHNPVDTVLERDQITTPGVIESALGDPLQDLLSKYTKNIRGRLNSSMISPDETGLQVLIVNENFRAALELTERILTSYNQGRGMSGHMSKNSVNSLRIWHIRFILLAKLKMYSAAESELEYFGNFERVDLSFEYYPHLYPGRSGSMVPFCLRLLWAEMPSFCDRTNDSLDRLSFLLSSVRQLLTSLSQGLDHNSNIIQDHKFRDAAVKYWTEKEKQVMYSIGNCLLNCMDYSAAFATFDELLTKLDAEEKQEEKMHLHTAVGRACLQLGDLRRAATCFKAVEVLINSMKSVRVGGGGGGSSSNSCEVMRLDHQIFMNKGLLLLCQNKYKEAAIQFQYIVQDNPQDVVASNNLAVTNVYLGRLKEASAALDRVIMKQQPVKKNSNENLIQNLSILFGNETPKSLGKKILLLEHVSKYKGDAFSTQSLRLT